MACGSKHGKGGKKTAMAPRPRKKPSPKPAPKKGSKKSYA